jgi:NTE family protein
VGRKFRLGLALGGGALRGLSHVGVLETLEKEGLPPDIVTGTSMGAIIGAMYATEPDVTILKNKINSYLESDTFKTARLDFLQAKDKEEGEGIFYRFSSFVRRSIFYTISITRDSFISEETFQKNLDYLLDDIYVEDTRIPFAATSVNLNDGEEFLFTRGPIRKAVAASCALPGILPPVVFDGKLLVDGGWIDAVPIEPARSLGADLTVGVDLRADIQEDDDLKNGLDIVLRSDMVTRCALAREKMKNADFLITPHCLEFGWGDYHRVEEIIRQGRLAAVEKIGAIKKKSRRRKLRKLFLGI